MAEPQPQRVINPDEPGMGHGRMGWLEADDRKFFTASAERNKGDIASALQRHLGALESGLVLEIGSGSGQHTQLFAQTLPRMTFQPTEFAGHPSPNARAQDAARIMRSIAQYCAGLANVLPPREQDAVQLAQSDVAADGTVDAVVAVNVIHVSPPEVLDGILAGAGAKLRPGGLLLFYGPFGRDGVITGDGNQRFQETLHALDPSYGIRDITLVKAAAAAVGLRIIEEQHIESSNNYINVFRKDKVGSEGGEGGAASSAGL